MLISDIRLFSDNIRLNHIFSIRFSLDQGNLNCEWSPRVPSARELKLLEKKYIVARDKFILEIADRIGASPVLVVAL